MTNDPQPLPALETGGISPGWNSTLRRLLNSAFGPFLALMLIAVAFSVADELWKRHKGLTPTFATKANAQQILGDSAKISVAALGMTLIIVAGGIDLSAGTAMALCATVTAACFVNGAPAAVAIAAGIGTGCLTGMVNGTLISMLRVVPFIVTLGTMTLFLGIGLILANDTPIRAYAVVPKWLTRITAPYPDPPWLQVSTGVWILAGLSLVVAAIFKYTVFGRHVFALGSNEKTARLCGIHVTRVRILVYTIAGAFIGVAGIYQFASLGGEGNPNGGNGQELRVIAAVVIGGGSLSGGRGSVLGTLSGAIMIQTINSGCVTLGIPSSYRQVILGVIIIAAVTLDQVRQRRLDAAGAG